MLAASAVTAALTGCASLGPTVNSRTGPSGDPVAAAAAKWPWKIDASVGDTISTSDLGPGVRLHTIVQNSGPVRAFVLDIDLSACMSLRALKGAPTSVGRMTTGALLAALSREAQPVAAVNADFFLFAPPGVPVGALVVDGQLMAGPIGRPVLAFDNRGRPYIGPLSVRGSVTSPRVRVDISTWNRPTRTAAGIVDAAWGQPMDSLVRPTTRMLVPIDAKRYVVSALPPAHNSQAFGDTLLLVGTPSSTLEVGDVVQVTKLITPVSPRTAVGGFPLLLQDSLIMASVDSAGAASFRGLNPRTAVGIGAKGRRLLLIVIDGRQPGYSMGTTTRATADLLRALGARDAMNLDGGGSSAMVVRNPITGEIRAINKPSDATGERPVGDALGLTRQCK